MQFINLFLKRYCELEKLMSQHEWDFILKGDMNNSLGYLNEKLIKSLIAAGCVVCFIICVVLFLNSINKHTENKRWICGLFIGGVIVFGVGSIVLLIA